jgi:hypothetical protein
MIIRNLICTNGEPVTEYIPENDEDRKQIEAMMRDGTLPSPPETKNWVRLCGVLDGFYVRYGCWPARIRMHPHSLSEIRDHTFTSENFAKIIAKVALIEDEASMRAEDDFGRSYDYSTEGFPNQSPSPSAAEWLGVQPRESIYTQQNKKE